MPNFQVSQGFMNETQEGGEDRGTSIFTKPVFNSRKGAKVSKEFKCL